MKKLLLVTGLAFFAIILMGQPVQPDSDFHIYLVMGQSNMAGRGKVEGKFIEKHHSHLWMMDKEGKWVQAKHPVHFDKPTIVGVGPALSFGIKIAKSHRDKKIGLVPTAVGGTSIQHWKPGAYDVNTKTHPWDDAVVQIRKAMKSGVVKGVIWHQGESDAAPEKSAHYLDDLAELIARIRVLTGDPELPFVAGQLGHYKEPYQNINRVLENLPAAIECTAVASARRLKPMEDGVHFDSKSADKLGRRMAKKMLKLENRKK